MLSQLRCSYLLEASLAWKLKTSLDSTLLPWHRCETKGSTLQSSAGASSALGAVGHLALSIRSHPPNPSYPCKHWPPLPHHTMPSRTPAAPSAPSCSIEPPGSVLSCWGRPPIRPSWTCTAVHHARCHSLQMMYSCYTTTGWHVVHRSTVDWGRSSNT